MGEITDTLENHISHTLEDRDLLRKASLAADPQTVSHLHETHRIRDDDETMGTASP